MAKKWDICMQKQARFDWLATSIAVFIAAFFALTARFNNQPAPSFVPAAVLSATGCGLLVTALRKMRGRPGVGLFEAGLSGFALAFFQFAVSFTYPGIFTIITTIPPGSHAFLLTWGLIGFFAVVLSIAGAALGHLLFAPLRSLPAQAVEQDDVAEIDEGEESEEEKEQPTNEAVIGEIEERQDEETEHDSAEITLDDREAVADEKTEDEDEIHSQGARQPHTLIYTIGVLLIGLLPMMIGYVFAAAYDFAMNAINVQQLFPGIYPTLSLLSGLLPWRLAVQIDLANINGLFILFTLLWRIPDSALGNPNIFDVQALEPLLFNAIALAILLFTMYKRESYESQPQAAPWRVFIGFEALLGLLMILPSDLWLVRGLDGILQFQGQVSPLPPLPLLNTTMFILNLITGVVFSVLVGLIVRRQYQLWTQPRAEAEEALAEEPYEEEILLEDHVL